MHVEEWRTVSSEKGSPEGCAEMGACTAAEPAWERSTSLSAMAAPWRTSHRGLTRSAHRPSQSAWKGHAPAWMASQAASAALAAAPGSASGTSC